MNPGPLQLLSDKYLDHIANHSKITDKELQKEFLNLLQLEDPKERLARWQNFKVRVPAFKQLIHLANPYFIGYGNPDSDILFLGKEKAFNMKEEPELFINESVNSLLQWKHILSQNKVLDHQKLMEELGFNPMFPRPFFSGKFKKRHTWGIYAEIVRKLEGLTGDLLNSREYTSSFFGHCFLSEINYIPSRYSEGMKLDAIRKEFLQQDFYRRFPIVIIGAMGYLNSKDIQDIFGTTKEEELDLGKNKSRNIKAKVFTSPTQRILLCNQLSGAAGWTTEAIGSLVSECQAGNEKLAVI